MNERTFNTAIGAIYRTGLPGLLRRCRPETGACVLMFHGFTDTAEEPGIGNSSGLHLDIGVFEQMCELLAERYTVLSLEDVRQKLEGGRPLPPRSVVLTFDDGYRSNYELAFPVLKKYGLPATIFVATEFVDERMALWPDRIEYAIGHTELTELRYPLEESDTVFQIESEAQRRRTAEDLTGTLKMVPQEYLAEHVGKIERALKCELGIVPEAMPAIYRPLDWWQVKEMVASGLVSIGGHTHDHLILGRCEGDRVDRELCKNKEILRARGGVDATLFAYPNGQEGDHNGMTREALIRHGYSCAVTTEPGFNHAGSDLLALNRFGTWNSAKYLDVVASGTLKLIKEARQVFSGRAALA